MQAIVLHLNCPLCGKKPEKMAKLLITDNSTLIALWECVCGRKNESEIGLDALMSVAVALNKEKE